MVQDAQALKAKGDYKGAASKFEEAVTADGRNADAHWGLAWTLSTIGQQEKDDVKLTMAKDQFTAFIRVSKDAGKTAEAKAAIARLGGGS
jgi:Tfp pilus assembly protein PilF